jgi:hypothetical protein
MKKIQPASQESARYPTARQAGLTRRGFLRVVAAGAAGAAIAGNDWLVWTEAKPRPRGGAPLPHWQIAIDFKQPFQPARCSTAVKGIWANTWDSQVAGFLKKASERPGVVKVIVGVLRRFRCEDFQNDTRHHRVERAINKALIKHYQKRTMRRYGGLYARLKIRPPRKIHSPVPEGSCGDPAS